MSRVNGFVGRRDLLKLAGVGGVGLAATAASSVLWGTEQVAAQTNPQPVIPAAQPNPEVLSPDAALKRLLDGNKRFVQQKRENPNQSLARLRLIAKAQHPFVGKLKIVGGRYDLDTGEVTLVA